jgi:hypothetical protein
MIMRRHCFRSVCSIWFCILSGDVVILDGDGSWGVVLYCYCICCTTVTVAMALINIEYNNPALFFYFLEIRSQMHNNYISWSIQ